MNINKTPKDVIKNSILAAFGLFIFGFGVYLTIQANLGAAPWDTFSLGLSKTLGIKYGTASISISFVIILIDILMKEKIGIGMFLDAIVVGKTVDFFNWLDLVKPQTSLPICLVTIILGLAIMGFAQYIYMKAELGCGPRDTVAVGLKRRLEKVPIGVIVIGMLSVATCMGWILGGPIGIGTIICAALTGPLMQLAFRIVGFVPTAIEHQSIIDSFRILLKNK